MKGLFLEDLEIGATETLGSHHFTREAILTFARAYDPQAFHLDDTAAKASHFGALCASGWHTAAAWMKCFVAFNDHHRKELAARGERLPELGPSPGVENLRWLKPVYVGDTITYSATVTAKRDLTSRPGWGLASFAARGVNQNGEEVFRFDGKVMVARR